MEQLTVAALPASAPTARRFLAAFCKQQHLADPVVDDAVLLVSELTGNAVLHARSEARIRVELRGTVLRIEVADDTEHMPQMRTTSREAVGGRGIQILDHVSSRGGAILQVEPPPGKVVWFELVTA